MCVYINEYLKQYSIIINNYHTHTHRIADWIKKRDVRSANTSMLTIAPVRIPIVCPRIVINTQMPHAFIILSNTIGWPVK